MPEPDRETPSVDQLRLRYVQTRRPAQIGESINWVGIGGLVLTTWGTIEYIGSNPYFYNDLPSAVLPLAAFGAGYAVSTTAIVAGEFMRQPFLRAARQLNRATDSSTAEMETHPILAKREDIVAGIRKVAALLQRFHPQRGIQP